MKNDLKSIWTKDTLKEKQNFIEVHEYKLLGIMDALFAQGIITEGTIQLMRNHLHDITNWNVDLYYELQKFLEDDK